MIRSAPGVFGPVFQMIENALHDYWVFDAGDDLDGAAAVVAGFVVNLEHSSRPMRTLKHLHLVGRERVVSASSSRSCESRQ